MQPNTTAKQNFIGQSRSKQFACVACPSCRPGEEGGGCDFWNCKVKRWTGDFEDNNIGYTDSSTSQIAQRKKEIQKQVEDVAMAVKPRQCVLLVGMDSKDYEKSGLSDEQHKYYLVVPTEKPKKATQGMSDRKEVFMRIDKGQWAVRVKWLERIQDRPLEFRESSDQAYAPIIGIRHCTVLGIIGLIGTDVKKTGGKYTVTSAFQKRIRKRNLFAFS